MISIATSLRCAIIKREKPQSEHVARLWKLHEKLGDVYAELELAKRA